MLDRIMNLFSANKTDFASLIREGAVIIDVRTSAEFHSGHIKGSRNIPLDTIKSKLAEIKKTAKTGYYGLSQRRPERSGKIHIGSRRTDVYNGGAWNALESRLK